MNEEAITNKGIWIQRELEIPSYYLTWLMEKSDNIVGFVQFDHPYEPRYLGSIGFLDIQKSGVKLSQFNFTEGLLQNHFYPLGGWPQEDKPVLVGKGLARRIELFVAEDLAKQYPATTQIVIGATSPSHLEYCKRIGIEPFKAMRLEEYIEILSRKNITKASKTASQF